MNKEPFSLCFRHLWEDKGAEMLRVIQLNTLEDRAVHDKYQWDSAINFLEKSLQEKLKISQAENKDRLAKCTSLQYEKDKLEGSMS